MSLSVSEPRHTFETCALGSGISVAFAPGPHLHRAAVACMFDVGARFEEPATAGLSHFLEHMLHRGTPAFPSAHALAAGIENLGASLDAATGVDHGSLVLTAPPETVLEAIGVLGEVVRAPIFSDLEVERGIVREELLEDRDERGRLVDPDGIVRAALFADHPLGFPIVGSPKTLSSFDVPMLRRHHARHYTGSTCAIAVAGKLPAKSRLTRALESAFGAVPRGRAIRPARFGAARTSRPREPRLTVTRTSSSQVSLRVACLGPGRRHATGASAELLLRMFDDGNATRLYEALCDRRGLCYEVSAGFEPYAEIGLFDVAAEAHEDAIAEVLSVIFSIFSDLADRGPTQSELDRARQRARWQAARTLDQPEAMAEQAARALMTAEPTTPFARAARMDACSVASVRTIARRMFDPGAIAVALVGSIARKTEREVHEIVRRYGAARGA